MAVNSMVIIILILNSFNLSYLRSVELKNTTSYTFNIDDLNNTTFSINTLNSNFLRIFISDSSSFIPKLISSDSIINDQIGNNILLTVPPNHILLFSIRPVEINSIVKVQKDTIFTIRISLSNETDEVIVADEAVKEFSPILIVLIVIFGLLSLIGIFFLIRFIIASSRGNNSEEDLLK